MSVFTATEALKVEFHFHFIHYEVRNLAKQKLKSLMFKTIFKKYEAILLDNTHTDLLKHRLPEARID